MAKFMKNNACCKDSTGGGNGDQDCLAKWKDELEEVCNQYNIAKAQTYKDKEAYENSLGWETKIKNWNDLIFKADEKAKAVVNELDFLLAQIKIVCDKSKCTNDSIEKLICLVKFIFDCFVTYDKNKAGLKEKLADLKKEVDCLKKVGEDVKAEVLKCIDDYEQKILKVCALQDDILAKLLETLKCAQLLYSAICREGGLKDKLVSIRVDFAGAPSEDEEHCDPDDEKPSGKDQSGTSDAVPYPCDDKKAKIVPTFPISEGDYYKGLSKDLAVATVKTEKLKEAWIQSKKASDSKLSRKTSLTEAIKAAEAAESGK